MADDSEGVPLGLAYNERSVSTHALKILEQLNIQRFFGAFSDICVQVDDCEMRLHKCVLAAASTKLQTMMYGVQESNTNSIIIHDVTLLAFRCIVEFVYTGMLKIDTMSVHQVLNAAQFFEMRNVEASCLDFMKSLSAGPISDSKLPLAAYRPNLSAINEGPSDPGGSATHPPPTAPLPMYINSVGMPSLAPTVDPQSTTNIHNSAGDVAHPLPPATLAPPMSSFTLPQAPPIPIHPPPMPYPNQVQAMDSNHVEDYLKLFDTMQGEQAPPPPPLSMAHPSQSIPPIGTDLSLHPPPPLYLQPGIGYGPPPGAPGFMTRKDSHLSKKVSPHCVSSLSGGPCSTSIPSNSHLSVQSMVDPGTTRPHTSTSMTQYSPEDVRRTILNVLSQEKFDDDDDDSKKDDPKKNSEGKLSLTSLLHMAPIHRREPAKTPTIDPNHFEDISEIEDMSNTGDDVDVEVDDDGDGMEQATVEGEDHQAAPYVKDKEEEEDTQEEEEEEEEEEQEDDYPLCSPSEDLQVDDSEEPLPESVGNEGSPDDRADAKSDVINPQPPEYYQLQNISPPTTPLVPAERPTSSAAPQQTVSNPDVGFGHCEASGSSSSSAVLTGLPTQTSQPVTNLSLPNNNTMFQIIFTAPPLLTNSSNIHRDPSLSSKPLKKRIKMQVKKKIGCDQCGREFYKIESLNKHKLSHRTTPLKSCHICGQKFSRLSELTRHLRTHSTEVYNCWDCSAQFNNPRLYKTHAASVHGEHNPFYCVHTGCSFRSNKLSNLERHVVIHSDHKAFICFQCGKSFAQKNGLRSHLQSCLEQRGYLCDICGAKFNHLQSMQGHRLLHTGEKPHVCAECGSTFTDARNYKRHRRIHDNVFPYPCTHCTKKFRHSNSLKNHLSSHETANESDDKSQGTSSGSQDIPRTENN